MSSEYAREKRFRKAAQLQSFSRSEVSWKLGPDASFTTEPAVRERITGWEKWVKRAPAAGSAQTTGVFASYIKSGRRGELRDLSSRESSPPGNILRVFQPRGGPVRFRQGKRIGQGTPAPTKIHSPRRIPSYHPHVKPLANICARLYGEAAVSFLYKYLLDSRDDVHCLVAFSVNL